MWWNARVSQSIIQKMGQASMGKPLLWFPRLCHFWQLQMVGHASVAHQETNLAVEGQRQHTTCEQNDLSVWSWYSNAINHPPVITIFMGGISHQKWVVYYCYTHIRHISHQSTCWTWHPHGVLGVPSLRPSRDPAAFLGPPCKVSLKNGIWVWLKIRVPNDLLGMVIFSWKTIYLEYQ